MTAPFFPLAPPAAASLAVRFRPVGWLFTLAVVGALATRRLLTEGMFGDGLTYASIARNLAEGRGTAWAPYFSSSFWLPYNVGPTFYDHPPLQFWLQAGLFRLIGDTPYTERVYCGIVIGLITLLLVGIWRQLLPKPNPLRAFDWLPVLVWYTFRTVEWASAQNLLDSTMSLFCLLAVWLLLHGNRLPSQSQLSVALAAGSLLLAFLTKGPVSLHVLAMPVMYGLVSRKKWDWVFRRTFALILFFAAFFGLLWLHNPARQFLQTYFHQQIWASLSQARENTAHLHALGRFYILQLLLTNALPALVLGVLLRWSTRSRAVVSGASRVGWFGLGLALAASLPISLSVKQFHNYAVPAFPYLALALAGWLAPLLATWVENQSFLRKNSRMLTQAAVAACLAVGLYGWRIAGEPFWAERKVVEDVRVLDRYVERGAKVGVYPELMRTMIVHAYLQRYHQIELTAAENAPTFVLTDGACRREQVAWLRQHGYQPVTTPLQLFVLFKKRR